MTTQIALPENYEDICTHISDMIVTAQKKVQFVPTLPPDYVVMLLIIMALPIMTLSG